MISSTQRAELAAAAVDGAWADLAGRSVREIARRAVAVALDAYDQALRSEAVTPPADPPDWLYGGYRNALEPFDTVRYEYAVVEASYKGRHEPPRAEAGEPEWKEIDWERFDHHEESLWRREHVKGVL